MSLIKPPVFATRSGLKRKAAVLMLALAALAGCAQEPAAPSASLTRASTALANNQSSSVLKTTTCARPEYPQDAHRRGSQGTTTVRFLIDTDGSVAQSAIVKSSGDASLDEAARSALAKCRFKPAVKDGQARRAWVPVQYVWSLEPAGKAPAKAAQP